MKARPPLLAPGHLFRRFKLPRSQDRRRGQRRPCLWRRLMPEMTQYQSQKAEGQEQDQKQGDPAQSLMAGQLLLRRLNLAALLVQARVVAGHGSP